jgi:hypothetical protein
MVKTFAFAMLLGLSSTVVAQQAQPGMSQAQQSAAADASGPRCDFMSREEMLMCQATKQGDVSGVRSSQCDIVSANTIERCLKQKESVSSGPANEFRDRKAARGS